MNSKFLQSGGLITLAAVLTLTIQNLLVNPATPEPPRVDQPVGVEATASGNPYLGEIMLVGFNFAPRGWAFCDGQLLPIAQNTALFSLLGTTYGGDGRTTFGLPDLRGRAPVHVGQGPGLSPVQWGQKWGNHTTTLTVANLPTHTHTGSVTIAPGANDSDGDTDDPTGNFPAVAGEDIYTTSGNVSMGGVSSNFTTNPTGSSTSFSNQPPSLGMYYVIALQGIYPSRN